MPGIIQLPPIQLIAMESETAPQPSNILTQNSQLEDNPPEEQDPWFDDDSEKQELAEQEQDVNQKVTIAVSEPKPQEKSLALSQEEVSEGELRYNQYYGYDHQVSYNYLVLLMVLNSHRMINLKQISGLQEGFIEIETKKKRLIVKTKNSTVAARAIQKISDFVDKLSVLKLDLKGNLASKCSNFSKLKEYLRKDGIVLFGAGSSQIRQIFIGGTMKLSELKAYQQHIKSIRVQQFSLRILRNTRSYKLIVEELLSFPNVQQELMAFNQIKFAEVDRWNRFREIKIILGAISKRELSSADYEDFLMKQLRRHCVVAFCYPAVEKYLQKPKVEGVAFKFVSERAVKKSYMYVIALKEDFVAKQAEIRAEVGKLNNILAVRLFYHLFPGIFEFSFNKEHYYLFRYPHNRPYSVSVSARSRRGYTFNWAAFMDSLVEVCAGRTAKALIE